MTKHITVTKSGDSIPAGVRDCGCCTTPMPATTHIRYLLDDLEVLVVWACDTCTIRLIHLVLKEQV